MAFPSIPLGQICRPKQWKTLSKSELLPEGFPVYGANGRIGFTNTFTHEKPTLLVGCRGSCGTIHITDPFSYANGNAMALDDLDEARVDIQFLACFLRHRGFDDVVSGSSQPQIIQQNLVRVEVLLPSLPEQRRIAAILDQTDGLRAKRREALAQLDCLTQSIFIKMFGDPVENPRSLPVRRLIDLVDGARPITYGILMPGPDQETGVKYVRVVDMRNGGIDISGIRTTTHAISNGYKRSLLKPGDLLMSIRGHVGRLAVVPKELDGANITQDTARFAITGADPIFVRECLRTPGFQRWMAKHTKGVAVRGINLGDVKVMPVIVPSASEQQEFSRRAIAVGGLIKVHRTALADSDALFASLQHRAFAGQPL
jgi:type I restriction enzyme S subunit